LEFDENATHNGASNANHVNGPVAKKTNTTNVFEFPIGDGTNLRPASITPEGTGASEFTAQYFGVNYGNNTPTDPSTVEIVSNDEYWDISRSGTVRAKIELTWNTSTSNISATNFSNLGIVHFNGSSWDVITTGEQTGVGDATSGYVTSGFYDNYSPFTLAKGLSTLAILPVELLSFEGRDVQGSVELFWSTASEKNNDYFEIERSFDGNEFVKIGVINGQGNSNSVVNYEFVDNYPYSIGYYRLKQVDFDGTSSYSSVILVNAVSYNDLEVYPNPVKELLKIRSKVSMNNSLITIRDVMGRSYIIKTIETEINGVELDVSQLKPGVYIIVVQQEGFILLKENLVVMP